MFAQIHTWLWTQIGYKKPQESHPSSFYHDGLGPQIVLLSAVVSSELLQNSYNRNCIQDKPCSTLMTVDKYH